MNSCGDPDTGNIDIWYPVTVSHKNNLKDIRNNFCSDAFVRNDENDEIVIQIASFSELSRATKFAQELEQQGLKEVRVGESYFR